MNDLLPKIFDSDYVLPKIFVGLTLAILFWSVFGPTGGEPEYDAEGTQIGTRPVTERMRGKRDKEAFLAKMLRKEQGLTAKYRNKSKQHDDDQGSDQGRLAWKRERDRKQRSLTRFKDHDDKNPDSVKARMRKSLEDLEDDRPR